MSLAEAFQNLTDPRRNNARHPFFSILFIALCAIIAGADSFEDIERWGIEQRRWLLRYIPIPHGIPSADTFIRVFSGLCPESFNNDFVIWAKSRCRKIENEVIAIDGKTNKASKNKADGIGALHMVSAWATENGLVLAQDAVENKKNEITSIPKVLKMLDLNGCIVTIDAMGCQKDIAQLIIKSGGRYLLGLKDNHKILHDRVKELFTSERTRGFVTNHGDKIAHSFSKTFDNSHGRDEYRRCWVIGNAEYLDEKDKKGKQFGFNSVVCIETEFHKDDKISIESRYFISTISADAKLVLASKRKHWGIENVLHWVLDVSFNEDRCSVRDEKARENMAILRHVALNLIRLNTSLKGGVGPKRKLAAWNPRNLLAIINS